MEIGLEHSCWLYNPRAQEGLLSHNSAHSKIVKTSIAVSWFGGLVKKPCPYKLTEALAVQVTRLEKVGYPERVILGAAEGILKYRR